MIEAELPDGTVLEFPDGTSPAVMQATAKRIMGGQPAKPAERRLLAPLDYNPHAAAAETSLALGSGAVAAPVAGLVGIAQGAKNALFPGGMAAGDRVRQVQGALTYEPATKGGRALTGAIAAPFELLASGADAAGGTVAEATGSPALGAAVNTGIQALPAVLTRAGGPATAVNARAARIQAEVAAERARNAVRDQTLADGQAAGYVVPPSVVNPSGANRILESLAGKAALGQDAQIRNQAVTNRLAGESVGLPPNTPITEQALQGVRAAASGPYRDVAALPPVPSTNPMAGQFNLPRNAINPAADLEALRRVRQDAQMNFRHYQRSADPAALERARTATADAQRLEVALETAAQQAGRADLIPMLRAARQRIARTYDVERGLNLGSANVDPRSLGRSLDNRPLSGELETIGRFTQAFQPYMRDASNVTTPGVSALSPIASAGLGIGGAAAAGPVGAAAAALPLLRGPTRSLILSDWYQRNFAQPNYAQPITLPTQTGTLAELLAAIQASQGQ